MSERLRVLDLFSGIGGFSLGLERAGFETVAFCEIEPYCRAVLKKHWPEVPCYEDIKTLTADILRRDGVWPIDAICGGFPCQDLSYAGKRAGIEGARSGLWSEYARLIGEIRPRIAIMENVPGLLSAGHGRVLGDLAALGYDAVWDCVPASALGAPHRRDRVWIVAHAQSERRGEARQHRSGSAQRTSGSGEDVADANETHAQRDGIPSRVRAKHDRTGGGCEDVPNSISGGRQGPWLHVDASDTEASGQRETTELVDCCRSEQRGVEPRLGRVADGLPDWLDEPAGIPRVATGIENRAARLKALGNAIVPQVAEVAEVIGRAVIEGLR